MCVPPIQLSNFLVLNLKHIQNYLQTFDKVDLTQLGTVLMSTNTVDFINVYFILFIFFEISFQASYFKQVYGLDRVYNFQLSG